MALSLDGERKREQRVTKGLLRDIPNEPIVYKKLSLWGGEHSSIQRGLADPKTPFPKPAISLPPTNIHIFQTSYIPIPAMMISDPSTIQRNLPLFT